MSQVPGSVPARRRAWRALLLLLPVAACAPQAPPVLVRPGFQPYGSSLAPAPQGPPRNRVALLLPLTGSTRALGGAMLNAAQLALFDQGDARVEFLPRDTRGTPAGAAEATRAALNEGARAVAGPLTRGEAGAAAGPARAANVPVLAFTSDASLGGSGVWVVGLTPAQGVDRVVGAAAGAGARRFGLLAAEGELGQLLARALRARTAALGLPDPVVVLHAPRGDAGRAGTELAAQAGTEGLDAVLLGSPVAAQVRAAAAAITAAVAETGRGPRFLGTPLMGTDAALRSEPALTGAWYAGSDPAMRAGFEARYQQAYGERPPPLAGVAYDAAALAARTVRDGGTAPPVGEAFQGADGPLRLLPDGQAARGLALFEVTGGEPRIVEPAPIPGAAGS